jgi:hypothetical protein
MIGVAFSIILLGLVASFSPFVIATVASQLTRRWPVTRALAVLTGVAIATAMLELMALGLLAGIAAILNKGDERAFRIAFDFTVGALFLFFFLRLTLGSGSDKESIPLQAPEQSMGANDKGLKRLFVVGFTLMILNAKAALLIAAAVTQIRALTTWIEVGILLIVLYLLVMLFPSMPVAAYIVSPKFATKIPELTTWMMSRAEPSVVKAKSAKRWLFDDHVVWVKVLTLSASLVLLARGVDLLSR